MLGPLSGCFPPRPNNQASTDVFVNNKGLHRETDSYSQHCCKSNCHVSVLAKGSRTVFCNGLPVGRITDPVACGSAIAQGSPNTFAG
jgi:uncharacterized Zn-binding protein involved in type VI secretion